MSKIKRSLPEDVDATFDRNKVLSNHRRLVTFDTKTDDRIKEIAKAENATAISVIRTLVSMGISQYTKIDLEEEE